jgi:two-component system sensor histidine kinase ChvG
VGGRGRAWITPLTWRILAINLLAPALLGGGLLFLGDLRSGLIQARVTGLIGQADLIGGALGETAIRPGETGPSLEGRIARQVVRRLIGPSDVRARLFDESGDLIADSRSLVAAGRNVATRSIPAIKPPSTIDAAFGWIYDRFAGWWPQANDVALYEERQDQQAEDYVEVLDALAGYAAAQLRRAENGSFRISVAVPVQGLRKVVGALMLDTDTAAIEAEVRTQQFNILKLFLAALTGTVLLSLYLASTIARPIRQLAQSADQVRWVRGRRLSTSTLTDRNDEIGELAVALRDMTDSLYRRLDAIEMFVADVTHEIKNPLTSLGSAVETLERTADPVKQHRLTAIIIDDLGRLDRLLGDIGAASRLDTELSRTQTEPVDMRHVLRAVINVYRETGSEDDPKLELEIGGDKLLVAGIGDRMGQVLRNLLDNARSFSPTGGTIWVKAGREQNDVWFSVEDQGPGIPEGKLNAIFDRFYTERPEGEAFGTHSGLGLSISRQIVEAFGGAIAAANLMDDAGRVKGAQFIVRLPALGRSSLGLGQGSGRTPGRASTREGA